MLIYSTPWTSHVLFVRFCGLRANRGDSSYVSHDKGPRRWRTASSPRGVVAPLAIVTGANTGIGFHTAGEWRIDLTGQEGPRKGGEGVVVKIVDPPFLDRSDRRHTKSHPQKGVPSTTQILLKKEGQLFSEYNGCFRCGFPSNTQPRFKGTSL